MSFVYSGDEAVLVFGGQQYFIKNTHHNWDSIKAALLEEKFDAVVDLFNEPEPEVVYDNVPTEAVDFFYNDGENEARYENNILTINGEEVHNSLAGRVRQMKEEGFSIDKFLRFVENLENNPSYSSQQELYDFLEHKMLPLTEDGHFLAYKAVQEDFTDKHSGRVSNAPGARPKMKRGKVDDNRDNGCSKGYHAGTLDYVNSFGYSGDKCVIVKINPKDVVSVPTDCNCQKLRTCEYEVLREYEGDLEFSVYDEDGESLVDDYEEDYYEEGIDDWD
jgi:hypothetical protein